MVLEKGTGLFLVFDPASVVGDGTLTSLQRVMMLSGSDDVHGFPLRYRGRNTEGNQ